MACTDNIHLIHTYLEKNERQWLGILGLGLSSVILLFVKICSSIFPFDVWDGLWVLIRPISEVSLLL